MKSSVLNSISTFLPYLGQQKMPYSTNFMRRFIAYLILKVLDEERKTARFVSTVSSVSFTPQLIEGRLCAEWKLSIQQFIKNYIDLYGSSLPKSG
ncbi:hypothetical protein E1B06_19635 [Brevibacillus laterosporus]|nr:hypothetical protein [Brevibacillus halotolerans]MDF9413872.1 hypothetical protein [Brevibacillus laterosporus]